MDFLFVQFLNGLASASSLFLVASGLSIIFGVTRIVNFAHGAFYMLGAYIAYTLTQHLTGVVGFWTALLLAALIVAALGALIEMTLLRRIYDAPELFQLLATFGLTLMVEDLVVMIWGPMELLGPRAPGLEGAVPVFGQLFPAYDFVLIALGPVVLGGLWLLFKKTRWGVLVRAATQDRTMVSALGVNQSWLFTSVFALGIFLAALGGAVQIPREAVHHMMDLQIIVEVFVVVVIGGLGNVFGAFLAAVIISELNAFGILLFPKISLVLVFLVMAVVLVVRPHGLLGKAESDSRPAIGTAIEPFRRFGTRGRNAMVAVLLGLALVPLFAGNYLMSVGTELLIFALFAASLHLMMGVGGMVSFGHAAYFGLGAYGAGLLVKYLGAPMEAALVAGPVLAVAGAILFGWFCVRLSGVYLAMLTLAFAQIVWSIMFQWYDVTGGDNGILGIWPSRWASDPMVFYYVTLALCAACIYAIRRIVFSPFGYAVRGCRDSVMRAESIGIDRQRIQWLAFTLAGTFAGIAGTLYAYLKGSVFPDVVGIPTSVDGLVMVLLGGLQTVGGPIVGAAAYKALSIWMTSQIDFWKLVLGALIVVLVIAFPEGIAGFWQRRVSPLFRRSETEEEAIP
ncbi:ABC transporter permease [Caenispirillum bisanense]|uniref:Amino acid/amide ABC transporter membrane protein 1, HAAT family /amino acid/amide ABC transporter membrane protein 2, HAAT family n=1 Tax=Caenispirillum bisanense TaxID=414052 RepID=A0A286GFF5_9PROT|nr:ABC transporter permease [Caenispirillum bisanense]SOD93859.1 amino acid/amide ABC transporter membrane protein 1, HAAT family /amino acid/amide ABC transporter membrane protein 2, HAAT family [Caenispirillum bisanense]